MQGSFTGPRVNWPGSSLRTEATGYGLVIIIALFFFFFFCTFMFSFLLTITCSLQVFFAQLMLADMNKELKGLRFYISPIKLCIHSCLILYLYDLLYYISQHFSSPWHPVSMLFTLVVREMNFHMLVLARSFFLVENEKETYFFIWLGS